MPLILHARLPTRACQGNELYVCLCHSQTEMASCMVCPACNNQRCHRARRTRTADYAMRIVNERPWRCDVCGHRFYARVVALRLVSWAHCSRCGNFDLQRISREYVLGAFAWLPRLAKMPALRCEPCRHRFFSLRPL